MTHRIELEDAAALDHKRWQGTAGAGHQTNPVCLVGFSQATLSVSSTAAQTAALDAGVYDVWCDDCDVYLKIAATANAVTTSTGYKLATGSMVSLYVPSGGYKLGGITAGVSGTLRYHRTR